MEILTIIYNIQQNSIYAVNIYMPLYYCSILLYAGLLSSFGRGTLKKVGDVSLATGSVAGWILYSSIMIITQMTIPFYISYYVIKRNISCSKLKR